MTKFYRSHGRRRTSRKLLVVLLLLLVAAIAAGGAYVVWQRMQITKSKSISVADVPKFVSIGGSYLFSIPAKHIVDETAIPGVAIVYPETITSLAGKNLEELYKAGAVAVQPISELKDNNPKAFKDYVNKKLAEDLRKSTRSNVDVRETKHGKLEALQIFALDRSGKRLTAMYAINQARPVLMVAKEESNTLKIVGSSMEELQSFKSKSDLDTAIDAAKTVAEMMQKQDVSGLKSKGNTEFNKNASELSAQLKASATFLSRSITITGGSYNGKDFAVQLIFEPAAQGEAHARGVMSLHKQDNIWKLQALELPSP